MTEMNSHAPRLFSRILFFFAFALFVLIVNVPVIQFNMIYPEQPLMYVANQQIHSLTDLFKIYLHPQQFHAAIPFFRPSGHFLIYQLLTPIIGWHANRLLICVNLLFLAGVGYYTFAIYLKLFPKYWAGGLIAFALYLAHPSLSLVKLTVMHFEFAYIFFVMGGLYYFIIFTHRNVNILKYNKINSASLLALTLVLYLIGITFKESAIMLGPVMIVYFCLFACQNNNTNSSILSLTKNKNAIQIIALLTITTIVTILYITLSWPTFKNPNKTIFTFPGIISVTENFLLAVFDCQPFHFSLPNQTMHMVWRHISFPDYIKFIMVTGIILSFTTLIKITLNHQFRNYKNAFIFLLIASLVFLILPLGWGEGLPWHFSMTLLMLCLLIGFSTDFFLYHIIQSQRLAQKIGFLLAILIGLSSIQTNDANIHFYQTDKESIINLVVIRNAVLHPPSLISPLNNNSLIIIGDNIIHNPYVFGAGQYPYSLYNMPDYLHRSLKQLNMYLKPSPVYDSSLFKFAYLNAQINEEIMPISVNELSKASNGIIYQWFIHYPNLFFLSHDANGIWHDSTIAFKENLLREIKKRHLVLRSYHHAANTFSHNKSILNILLPKDIETCQFYCDQTKYCQSYVYREDNALAQCHLYR